VGKSSLVNRLLGRKVSIVSSKPQTTRHRVAGVLNFPGHQLVLLDMPGFQKPRDRLTERMQAVVETTLGEVDVILFMLNAAERIGRGDAFIAAQLAAVATPVVVALNKIDLVQSKEANEQLIAAAGLGEWAAIHLVSAVTGEGLPGLLEEVRRLLPEGPRYFPPGVVTDQPEELLIAELVREKVIAVTEEEVPHSIAVQVLEMESRGDDLVYVRAAIYVERDSQRPIVLGEAGGRIKQIGTEARHDIEALLGSRVFLDLAVKVRKHWRQDPGMLGRLGL